MAVDSPESPVPTSRSSPEQAELLAKESPPLEARDIYAILAEVSEGQIHIVQPGDTLYEIAKEYKTTVELISKTNGLKDSTIYPEMKLKIVTGTFSMQVDKSENLLTLFLNDKSLKHYRVATGTEDSATPAGEFRIVNKLTNPTWFKAGAIVPPGSPENLLGTRWLGFDKPGYGMHGTTDPTSIGQYVSHGCVRLLNEEIEELYRLIPMGTHVTITD